jgi:hypothetical protein
MHLTLKKQATKPAAKNFLQQQAKFDDFVDCCNRARPHQAINMHCPAELYEPSPRPHSGLKEPEYPFHDRTITVAALPPFRRVHGVREPSQAHSTGGGFLASIRKPVERSGEPYLRNLLLAVPTTQQSGELVERQHDRTPLLASAGAGAGTHIVRAFSGSAVHAVALSVGVFKGVGPWT